MAGRVRAIGGSALEPFGRRTLIVLAAVVFTVHVVSPSVQVTDSRLSTYTAVRMLHGDLDLSQLPADARDNFGPDDYDVVIDGDRVLPFFPWAPMLLLVPVVGVAQLVGIDPSTADLISPNQTWPYEMPVAALLVALTAVLCALLAAEVVQGARRLGAQPESVVADAGADADAARRTGMAAALLFAFSTGAWSTASRSLWQHTPAMVCTAFALLWMVRAGRDDRSLWPAGVAAGLGYTMRPTAAVVVAVLAAWTVVSMRDRLTGFVAGGLAVAVPFVAVNVWQYGAVLPPYFDPTRLGTEEQLPLLESLAVHVVSPARGLLVFTPVLLLVPWSVRAARRAGWAMAPFLLCGAILVLHWLAVGSYGSTAGSAYGSRFFTEVTPAAIVLLVPVLHALVAGALAPALRPVAVGLVAVSTVMAGIGATMRSGFCWSASPTHVDVDPDRLWDWSDPPFVRPFRELADGRPTADVVAGSCPRAH